MLSVSELYIYPIKSLGGIALSSATLTPTGFQYDRKWMLVDEQNMFLTQREHPAMALLQVELTATGLRVFHKQTLESISIPFLSETNETITVQVWDDTCEAQFVSVAADSWFSKMLSFSCRLVYMPDSTQRLVDGMYAGDNEVTAFSDGFPLLMIGQASLDDLNSRLEVPLPINRFRPNIVFTGGEAFEEDIMRYFIINDIHFYGVKLCARCAITTINQDTATAAKEPLRTLSTYRFKNNKIYFGQNVLHKGEGVISVGDKISVIKKMANNSLY